jgi:hypothetical protein
MCSSRSFVVGIILLVAVACPSVPLAFDLVRTHPDLPTLAGEITRIVLLPPRMAMYEIGAGGTLENKEDWTTAAEANIIQAIQAQAGRFDNLSFALLDEHTLSQSMRANYDETRALYDLVNVTVLMHTYEPNRLGYFPEKARNFRYSLGTETQALAPDADALLIVEGFDQRSSGGRKALQAGAMLVGAVLGVVPVPRGGGNLITVALVRVNTGEVLWFYRSMRPYDLRQATDASQFTTDFWSALPTFGK